MSTADHDPVPPAFTIGDLFGRRQGDSPAYLLPAAAVARPTAPRPTPPRDATPIDVAAARIGDRTEQDSPAWAIRGGVIEPWTPVPPRPEGVDALDHNNPYGQTIERVWFDGRIVYAIEAGLVEVDPATTKVAQEYQIVYSVTLNERGVWDEPPDMVEGQYNIYDSVPGMDKYSPIWQFNYVIVPHTYVPNTLRSEADCLASGYPIIKSMRFEN